MNQTRIDNLAKQMQKANLGGMLICPSEELLFLAGFTPKMCERFQALFVTAEGKTFFICNLLYQGEVEKAFGPVMEVYTWRDGESMTDVVKQVLARKGLAGTTMGVNSTAPAFNVLEIERDCGVTCVNGVPVIEEARIIKTKQELADLRTAAQITDAAFSAVLGFIKPGMKEADVMQFLSNHLGNAGGTDMWGIIASGPNSSYPHYHAYDRVIQEQDLMILDFGCRVNGLYSDMSRTIFVGGITDEQRKIYDIVRRAYEAGEKAAVNGAYIPDVDKASRDIIDNEGYGDAFVNRLGHGIGYMIHEAPDIKKNNHRNLEPGMAFSIEPGIYLAGKLGMRIENIVVATADGNEVLNKSSKDIIII